MKHHQASGFTLIELLIVIAIIGILATVMLPSLLGSRAKASDTTAKAVAREVINAMAAIEANATGSIFSSCTWAAGVVSYKEIIGTSAPTDVSFRTNASGPITDVICVATNAVASANPATPPNSFGVQVIYKGGTIPTVTVTSAK